MLVCVTGVIGVGKSTLVEGLASLYGAIPFYEPLPESDNFMLEAYYLNPEKYAFSMQTLLLALRFRAQQEAQWRSQRGEMCLMDSSIYADKAFLEVQKQVGYIDDLEYQAYNKLCEIHYPYLQYPDLHIHLDLDLDREVERIKSRARDCESNIDVDYLKCLHRAYGELIPHLAKIYPLVRIDASCSKEEVLRQSIEAIEKRQEQMKIEAGWPTYKKNYSYVIGE